MSGTDTLVVMPTGSGESAVHQVPALLLAGPTVVVSSLLALQRDQVAGLVHHADGPVEPQDLAEERDVTHTRLVGLVNLLEQAGAVEVRPDGTLDEPCGNGDTCAAGTAHEQPDAAQSPFPLLSSVQQRGLLVAA